MPALTPRAVGDRLGLGKTAVARLIFLGRECRGRHPIWGGLWPVFKLGRARRVPLAAVVAHVEHMTRLETDGAWAAVCSARAGEARFAGVATRYQGYAARGFGGNFSGAVGVAEGVRTLGTESGRIGRGKRKIEDADAGRRMGLSAEARGLKGAASGRGAALGAGRGELADLVDGERVQMVGEGGRAA